MCGQYVCGDAHVHKVWLQCMRSMCADSWVIVHSVCMIVHKCMPDWPLCKQSFYLCTHLLPCSNGTLQEWECLALTCRFKLF